MSPFAPGAGAPTVRRWDWLCCRSTASVRTGPAQSTPHACPPSHPVRELLRFVDGFGFVVGAPPRCERGRHAFAPGAGAPTVRGWVWFCCRSTAHGANGVGTHSHPGRVLLRVGGGIGFCCRSTAPVRTGEGTNPPHPLLRAPHHNPAILSFTPAPITPWIYPNPPSRRPNAVSQATYQSRRLRLGRVSEAGRLYLI